MKDVLTEGVAADKAGRRGRRFPGFDETDLHPAEQTRESEVTDMGPGVLQQEERAGSDYQTAAAAVRAAQERLRQAEVESVESLAAALDARDPYTAGHSRRVSESACAIGSALGLGVEAMERLRVGALLHDIGKIGVGDAILQKKGSLTEEELALVRQHPEMGRQILEGVQGFSDFVQAVEQHHENWDGSGYPLGLRGEETAVEARIIHVVDAYDAMTTDRSYRKGMTPAMALLILRGGAGTQFDPEIVPLFAALQVELRRESEEEMEQWTDA